MQSGKNQSDDFIQIFTVCGEAQDKV